MFVEHLYIFFSNFWLLVIFGKLLEARLKALDEIYKIDKLLHLLNPIEKP